MEYPSHHFGKIPSRISHRFPGHQVGESQYYCFGYETHFTYGISQTFPKGSPGFPRRPRRISQSVPEPPMARQHYSNSRHFPTELSQHFPKRSPSGRTGYLRPSPNRICFANITAGISPTVFYLYFPKRPRGVSQAVPEPSMALQHYGSNFPDRAFPAFPPVGYPRPSPSRLWPANITEFIFPTGFPYHFPKVTVHI